MSQPTHPDLTQLASKMASNHARVSGYIDTLSGHIDELISATAREDWSEVQRLSGQIAEGSRQRGYRAVSALAQRVFDEAHLPGNGLGIKRSLLRLIGTSGRMERPRAGAT